MKKIKWFKSPRKLNTLPGAATPDDKQVIIDKMRKRYPTATREQCLEWHAEDAAFAAFASKVLDAANVGVDTSFLRTCPDLTALAMRRAGL